MAWGVLNLPPTDILLHPAGAIVTINSANHRMEMLKLPTAPMADADAAVNLLATLHGGQGTRPGLFDAPTVTAITAEGTVLIIESGNNRIHAVDIAGNPVRVFSKQPVGYFFNFSQTGGAGTQYLDVAVEFSGFIYVLSFKNPVIGWTYIIVIKPALIRFQQQWASMRRRLPLTTGAMFIP